jgi:hypothetical protein
MYSEAGYHFLFLTDHWIASDLEGQQQSQDLLWLNGIELDGQDPTGANFHVVCLGKVNGIKEEDDLARVMQTARQQGALLILAHPFWCANSFEDALRWKFDGVEVYNHVCHWLNGKGNASVYWNMLLGQNANTLGFAVDDAHIRPEHPGWNGGWIVVNSRKLDEYDILYAIRNGNFFSSQGPAFYSIDLEDDRVIIKTSPVQFIRLVGPGWDGIQMGSFQDGLLEEAAIKIPHDWQYHYIEIEDNCGRMAWTNSLFIHSE